jgi:hypothetical protein
MAGEPGENRTRNRALKRRQHYRCATGSPFCFGPAFPGPVLRFMMASLNFLGGVLGNRTRLVKDDGFTGLLASQRSPRKG